jgi:uncharacterized protein YxjI
MVYHIKKKFWSLRGNLIITDEVGMPLFQAVSAAVVWGPKLSFQDREGQELAFIERVPLSWRLRHRIKRDGQTVAGIVSRFAWFRQKLEVEVPGSDGYLVDRSFWGHEFRFRRLGEVVARVSRAFWSWTDDYRVDIVDGEDEVLILCACIVIDRILLERRSD